MVKLATNCKKIKVSSLCGTPESLRQQIMLVLNEWNVGSYQYIGFINEH